MISGIVFIVGAPLYAFFQIASKKSSVNLFRLSVRPTPPPPPPNTVFCRFCGAQNETDAVYCKKCGKNIGE